MQLILIALIVLAVAFFFSMVGLGGAIIYVPLFYWLGIDLKIAIPAALLLNFITSASASMTYHRQKMIVAKFAYPLIITSVVLAPAGAYFTGLLDDSIILAVFSVVLIAGSIRVFFPIERSNKFHISARRAALIGGGAGMVIGFASGMLGLGGGIFVVPLLLLFGLEAKEASATSAVFVMFTSLSGLLGHASTGMIDVWFMLYTGVAAFIGAQAGSHVMVHYMESGTVLKVFGVILLVMAAKIIYGLI